MAAAEQVVRALEQQLRRHHALGAQAAEAVRDAIWERPDEVPPLIGRLVEAVIDAGYLNADGTSNRAFVQAVAGGPYPGGALTIYNTLGGAYRYLTREQRDGILAAILGMLDRQNYLVVQEAWTPFLRDPLLLADIQIVRPLYWPGLDEGRGLIASASGHDSLMRMLLDDEGWFYPERVHSDYVVGYALLRSDFYPYGDDVAGRLNPQLRESIVHAVCAMRFAHTTLPEQIDTGARRLEQLLPRSLHDEITWDREKIGWVDPTDPRWR